VKVLESLSLTAESDFLEDFEPDLPLSLSDKLLKVKIYSLAYKLL